MSELSQTLQDVPLTGLIPVALMVLVGLVLWAAGQRVLRAGFGAAGLLLGGFLGWLAGETFNLGVPSWVAALFLGIVLACVAALIYRLAVAGALAMVFAVAAPLAVLSVHEMQGGEGFRMAQTEQSAIEDEQDEQDEQEGLTAPDEIDEWLDADGRLKEEILKRLPMDVRERIKAEFDKQTFRENGVELPEELIEHLEQLRGFADRLIDGIRDTWDRAPDGLRPYLIAAIVLGGLLGILIGTLIPTFSAAIITAFSGSLLWLAGVKVLLSSLGFAEAGWLPQTSRALLLTWIIIAIIGLALQWIFFSKRADKST